MEKIESIANQLYQHGIEAAEKKASELISEAEQKAALLLKEATQKAQTIEQQARNEADKLKNDVAGELKLAATRTLGELRNHVVSLVSENLYTAESADAAKDPEFITRLLIEVAGKAQSGEGQWEVQLPQKLQSDFDQSLRTKISQRLGDPALVFSTEFDGGFRIEHTGQHYRLDFTDKALAEFFRRFLKEKTTRILFEDK